MKNLIFSLLFFGLFHGNAQVTLVKHLINDEAPKSDKIEYNQIFDGRVYYFNSTSTTKLDCMLLMELALEQF